MTLVAGYDLKQGERVNLELVPVEKCPFVCWKLCYKGYCKFEN